MTDPYKTLGVSKSSSADDIRRAYRKLAREYHPDVNPGDKDAEDKFKEISAAYDVLSDGDKRKLYDEFGEESLKGGFDPEKARTYRQWRERRQKGGRPFDEEVYEFDFGRGRRAGGGPGADFGDLGDLGDLFGFGRRARRGPVRGADVHAVADLDLATALRGAEVAVGVPGSDKPVRVRIPKGADDGDTVRIRGKGAPAPSGGKPGDLVIECRVAPHPRVHRDGLDLTMRVPVTLAEAYNGATIEVPTFTGNVKVRVPSRSQPGTKLRLRGKGVERGGKSGDFYVELEVRLPEREDDALTAALTEADALYGGDVRKEVSL